jgi:hypothetical protein
VRVYASDMDRLEGELLDLEMTFAAAGARLAGRSR